MAGEADEWSGSYQCVLHLSLCVACVRCTHVLAMLKHQRLLFLFLTIVYNYHYYYYLILDWMAGI